MPLTPQQVFDRLVAILPGFAEHFASDAAAHRAADNSFTLCGVFADCAAYVRDHSDRLTPHQHRQLGTFISECMAHRGTALDTAAATCFLENLTFEPFSDHFATALSGEALKFYQGFQGPR